MYRNEHPNPQFQRESFRCLNGLWKYGKGKRQIIGNLTDKIEVPFCPESKLSGIEDKSFITDCVYSRKIELTKEDLNERLVLHFGAVDYDAEVYVNEKFAVRHTGGYTAFEVDIATLAHAGENVITVIVHDDVRENIPSGKQSKKDNSYGCFYTRSTGIWQTVWLEKTPLNYIRAVKFVSQPDLKSVKAEVTVEGCGEVTLKV